jgi:hypothetical protein
MINLVIAYSQQRQNKCKMGDAEHEHCYKIAQELYNLLKPDTRFNLYLIPVQNTGNDTNNLKESVRLSNNFISKYGSGYHLEIHTDAGGYATGASGLYYSENGKKFLTPILNEITALTPWSDVGLRERKDLYALKNTKAIAGLIELSFHDNSTEAKWIHDNIQLIAAKLRDGIYKSFNLNDEARIIHIIEASPKTLKFAKVDTTGSNVLKQFSTFINGMFYGNGLTVGTGYSEGKKITSRLSWDNVKRGTFIVYQNGTVEVCQTMDPDKERSNILFCVQGIGLNPVDFKAEWWPEDVGRKSERTMIGYNPKSGKALLFHINKADIHEGRQILIDHGCYDGKVLGIGLDSGTPATMVYNKQVYKLGSFLDNIIYV